MELGDILTQLRTERGLYQKELALYLNVSIGTISNYEQGIHCPDIATLCKLADYFNVSTDYLLGRSTCRYTPDILNEKITSDFIVSDWVNIIRELPDEDVAHITEYVKLLKLRHDYHNLNDK